MGPVLQSAFLRALGWSLIDSLWQMGLVWLIYLAITRNGRRYTANFRHNLALLSLAGGACWFIFTLVFNTFSGRTGLAAGFSGLLGKLPGTLDLVLPWLSLAYLVVIFILVIRLDKQLSYTKTLSTQGLRKAHPEIRVFLQHLAAQMGLKKEIKVWISELVETPLTVGFWKPVILLPVSIINNLTLKQTESIILHELYHIQRNDFLMNLLISVADIMLFFNPFAKFFKEVIQREREHRCDDIVMQFRYDPSLYAGALLILEKQRPSAADLERVSIAATGNNKMLLLARVRRLLTGETIATPISQKLIGILLPAILLGSLGWNGPLTNKPNMAAVQVVNLAEVTAPGSAMELPRLFVTSPGPNSGTTSPVLSATTNVETFDETDYDDEELNIEKDLANVIITKKVEELISTAATSPQIEFVKADQTREFTISIDANATEATVPTAPVAPEQPYPYVPGNSFTYKIMEDTAYPKNSSYPDFNSQAQLAHALNAIDGLNWSQIERNLGNAGEKLNVDKLQVELKKAATEIDWKSLQADIAKTSGESAKEIDKYRSQLAEKYIQFEKARLRKAERKKAAEVEIVEQRLRQSRPANAPGMIKHRKVVDI